jgi:hypothetical protein
LSSRTNLNWQRSSTRYTSQRGRALFKLYAMGLRHLNAVLTSKYWKRLNKMCIRLCKPWQRQ